MIDKDNTMRHASTIGQRTIVAAFCLIALSAVSGISAAQQGGPPPAAVKIDVASRQSMASTTLAPGTIISRNDARVAAELPGRLISVKEAGERVGEGDEIARIDDRALQLQLRDDNARIKRLQANLNFLESQAGRLRELAGQNNAARNQLDESLSQKAMAEQDLVVAKVDRDQTLYRIERSVVTAPFAGTIVERHAQAGEYVSVGAPVVRLVDVSNVEVQARTPLGVAAYLREGMPVIVRAGDIRLEGELRAIIPVGDARSRLLEVRIAISNMSAIIGSAVRVELPLSAPAEVLAVHRDALVLRQDATYLFKLKEDNTVEQVPVTTGIGQGSLVEVRGDVKDGDRVVVRGGERLRAGQSVSIAQES